MIDKQTENRIKEAAKIVDVIGEFYPAETVGGLRKMGNEYSIPCPFHGGHHYGSFKITSKKNYAHCFSCGWQGDPINFLMEYEKLSYPDALAWLGKKYSIDVEGSENMNVTPAKPRETVRQLPMLVLPDWMWKIKFGLSEENPFARWLFSQNWDSCQRDRILDVLTDYRIGEAKNGMVIYWQIDNQQRTRTGKMMLYNANGHRNKTADYNFDWVHSALYRNPKTGYSADKTDMKQCLFGLHLLDKYTNGRQQDVCIVESEKTAVYMAIAHGNNAGRVWMACGGLSNISREKLAPLIAQKRNIILYPDRDGISKWKAKAENLRYDRVIVDDEPVTKWWQPEDGEKADIADVMERIIRNQKIYKTVDEVVEDIPAVKELKEKMNLELT